MTYLAVKWLHVLSSTVLFGTGLGSAFYFYFISRSRDARVIAPVAKYVVIADWAFTTPAVLIQPLTGFYLTYLAGFPWNTPWITGSLKLYLLAGAAWVPVVWMQIRMRDMAVVSAEHDLPIPELYWTYLRVWVVLGVVAFSSLVAVFYLMVVKPV